MFKKDSKLKLFKAPKKGEILGEDPMHIDELPVKKVPDYMRRRHGVWYWTGAIITAAFLYQIISGLLLLLYYNPADAYASTEDIVHSIPYGSLILTTHLYGAYAMIFLIYVHLFRNYFFGSYKKPREIQWILGVLLLAVTVGVGYFGYSMSGDVLSSDATDVGRGIAEVVPFVGTQLEAIFFGNGTSVSLFQHMLAWHIILTALIGVLFGAHFWLAEANGFMPRHKDTNNKAPAIDTEKPDYKPWYPYNMVFIIQLGLFTFAFIFLIPSVLAILHNITSIGVPTLFDPFPQVSPSSPAAGNVPTYPPWFLLFIFKAVDFEIFDSAGALEALAASAVFGIIPLLYFILLPFIDRTPDTHPLSRPLVTSFGILGIIYLIILSAWGAMSPGIPIPTPEVLAVLLPPFVIVIGGIYFLSRAYKKGKFQVSQRKIITSFLIFLLILIIAAYNFGEGFVGTMVSPNGLNLVSTMFSGGVLTFGAIGTMKSAKMAVDTSEKEKKDKNSIAYYSMNTNVAMFLSALLMIGSIIIAYFILQLNPIGEVPNGEFGIGLAFIMIFAGLIVRIYRAAFYHE
ncbi:MAG: cytochrome bc complex cytochrome b subunit [Thermoplasmataceae archaeon]|jgi:quinol-cytochrome oxidoreductase complex cytochrome b subunit